METNRSFMNATGLTSTESIIVGIGLLVILLWLVACVVWARNMLNRFTYVSNNPYKRETLGLPTGTIRGLITLTLLIVVIVMISMSLLVESFRGAFDSLIDAFQVMLAFYFGSKVMHHVTSADKRKTERKFEAEKHKATVTAGNGNPPDSDFEISGSLG